MSELNELDRELALRYGAYASYTNDLDPIQVDCYGDDPAREVDRLLDMFAVPASRALDLGCGAGFTLCRLASRVAAVWGLEPELDLLRAARLRVAECGLTSVTLVHGSSLDPAAIAQLPEDTFDLVLSRRGPNVNAALLAKMKPEALVVQELFQDPLGLLEMFGRKTFAADIGANPRWLVDEYSWLGLFPVSVKVYYYDAFFRDVDHLAAYLAQPRMLFSWPMPPMPYEEERDRAALELYARYNTTPQGVRVVNHRKVGLFRRARVQYAPADPTIELLE